MSSSAEESTKTPSTMSHSQGDNASYSSRLSTQSNYRNRSRGSHDKRPGTAQTQSSSGRRALKGLSEKEQERSIHNNRNTKSYGHHRSHRHNHHTNSYNPRRNARNKVSNYVTSTKSYHKSNERASPNSVKESMRTNQSFDTDRSAKTSPSTSKSVTSNLTTFSSPTAGVATRRKTKKLPGLLTFKKKRSNDEDEESENRNELDLTNDTSPSTTSSQRVHLRNGRYSPMEVKPRTRRRKKRFAKMKFKFAKSRSRDDDDASAASDSSGQSKSSLIAEFGTLMNEFPTEDTLNTTLHVACEKHYSEDLIVRHLIAKGPMAVTMKNQKRDLPLHSACRCKIGCGIDDRVLDCLLDRYLHGVTVTNKEMCLPLHLACYSGGRNLYAIQRLIDECPESVMMKCHLKIPFDVNSLRFVQRSEYRPQTTEFVNKGAKDEASGDVKTEDPYEEDMDDFSSATCAPGNFWSALSLFSSPSNDDGTDEIDSTDYDMESCFSPLHLAVISGAPPDVVETIVTADPECLGLKTDKGRKAMDIARFLIAGKRNKKPHDDALLKSPSWDEEMERISEYIRNIDEDPTQNIFAAYDIMNSFEKNRRKSKQITNATLMTLNSTSMREVELHTIKEEFDAKRSWTKLNNIIRFTSAIKQSGSSALGKPIMADLDKVEKPRGYQLPVNFQHICVELELPVGFRRLRWAMLHRDSKFLSKEVLQTKLGYSQVTLEAWDKCNDVIGDHTLSGEEMAKSDIVGAERKCSYLMPKSGMVAANMAYETQTIEEYNEYAFVIKKVTVNPDVPFGNTFECHVQTIFHDMGYNQCKMIASVEANFIGRQPMVAWKIKNAMYDGVTDFFVAKGEVICEHALREKAEAEESLL